MTEQAARSAASAGTMSTGAESRVAVVGSANADLVVEVPRRPGGGETLLGGDLALLPGGKGANQAAAAARCGAEVSMVACVGDDANGGFLLSELGAAGVRVDHVARVDRPTGTAIIFLTPDGENSIVVSPGANQALDIAAVETAGDSWRGAAVVVLSLEIPLETALFVAAEARATGARVVLNAAPSVQLSGAVLALCDPLIVNEHEALEVLGAAKNDPEAENYPRLAERLLEAGARSVVVTLGADGAIVAERGRNAAGEGARVGNVADAPDAPDAPDADAVAAGAGAGAAVGLGANAGLLTSVPAYRVQAVDTTGAGDAFVGAVAGELAAGTSLVRAVRFATAVSAVSVQRVGAQTSYANRAEVEAFIAERSA